VNHSLKEKAKEEKQKFQRISTDLSKSNRPHNFEAKKKEKEKTFTLKVLIIIINAFSALVSL
jgi:hypothetical protein